MEQALKIVKTARTMALKTNRTIAETLAAISVAKGSIREAERLLTAYDKERLLNLFSMMVKPCDCASCSLIHALVNTDLDRSKQDQASSKMKADLEEAIKTEAPKTVGEATQEAEGHIEAYFEDLTGFKQAIAGFLNLKPEDIKIASFKVDENGVTPLGKTESVAAEVTATASSALKELMDKVAATTGLSLERIFGEHYASLLDTLGGDDPAKKAQLAKQQQGFKHAKAVEWAKLERELIDNLTGRAITARQQGERYLEIDIARTIAGIENSLAPHMALHNITEEELRDES